MMRSAFLPAIIRLANIRGITMGLNEMFLYQGMRSQAGRSGLWWRHPTFAMPCSTPKEKIEHGHRSNR